MGCNSCKNSKAEQIIKKINLVQGNDDNESIEYYEEFSLKYKILSAIQSTIIYLSVFLIILLFTPLVMIFFFIIATFKIKVKIPYVGSFNQNRGGSK